MTISDSGSGPSTGAYTVLARRYRPQSFADVIGQEHVAQALRNAIRANRVAHAYLFTGARGVGKTSTARILAKALNCPNAVDGDPCNQCEICQGITAGHDVDVLEIDGASNRGIEDIRQLRANVNVRSMRTQFKIYIIDEVHMLTKEAFNALLKTLEEPPPNVKFVFCTTEPNKLPDTILSRCQRFDFGTIETFNIRLRLRQIAESEGIVVDDDAIELVARRAAGSMRDSQSIFDQLLAFGGEHIGSGDVHRLLGTASDTRLIAIADGWLSRTPATAVDALHQALDGGVQLGELTDQLLNYLRDLMVLAAGAEKVELISVAPGSRETLAAQATQWGLQTIVAAMQILAETKGRMQRTTCGRALLELAIVRVSLLEHLASLDQMIDALRKGEPLSSVPAAAVGEKKNDRLTPAPSTAATDVRTTNDISTAQASVHQQSDEVASAVSSELPAASRPLGAAPTDGNPRPPMEKQPVLEPSAVSPQEAPVSPPLPDSKPRADRHSDRSAEPAFDDRNSEQEPLDDVFAALRADDGGAASEADNTSVSSATSLVFAPENADQIWQQLVLQLSDMMKSQVKPVSRTAILMPNRLEIYFPPKYALARRYCEKPDVLNRLEQIVASLTGVAARISVLQVDNDDSEAAPAVEEKPVATSSRRRVYRPEEDEFVSAVMDLFSAQVVNVTPISGESSKTSDEAGS